jgi:hypothetical protein
MSFLLDTAPNLEALRLRCKSQRQRLLKQEETDYNQMGTQPHTALELAQS